MDVCYNADDWDVESVSDEMSFHLDFFPNPLWERQLPGLTEHFLEKGS